jgi:hypothetical protein
MKQKHGALPPEGAIWQMGKSAGTIRKVLEISARLKMYKEHCDDDYAYHPEEIEEVRDMKAHAAKDIEFLLKEFVHL